MKKQSLRTAYKQKRKSLTPSNINSMSLEIANQALKLPIWEASFYHLFLSIKPLIEVETEPLLSILYGRDKNIVISKSNILNGEMSHYLLTDNTRIKPNIWNIPEPQDGVQIEASKLEVIFVPLLAECRGAAGAEIVVHTTTMDLRSLARCGLRSSQRGQSKCVQGGAPNGILEGLP